MGKNHFTEYAKKLNRKPITIVEMIAGRVAVQDTDMSELAEAMGCKIATAYSRMHQPITSWRFGEVIGACQYLKIPPEELYEKITY